MKDQRMCLDRISTFPKDIIETILCRVPIKDAARTSILSRNWRYNWLTIPKLVFYEWDFKVTTDENQLSVPRQNIKLQTENKRFRMINAIYQILLVHRGPIDKFALHMNADDTCVEIDQIILHLSKHYSVKKFKLRLEPQNEYTVPLSIFSLHRLTHLSLCNCEFYHHPTKFSGFRSLTTLYLAGVKTTAKELLHVISNSPLLKNFSMVVWADFADRSSDCTICEFFKCLPAVEHLSISQVFIECFGDDVIPQELPISLVHLKSFCLNEMYFYDDCGLPFILLIMRSSPNLEKIKLDICQDVDTDECKIDFAEYSDIWLEHLKELEIDTFANRKSEMEFLKLILVKSPVLKKVKIDLYHTVAKDEELKMLRSLLRSPHASPDVDIIVEPYPYYVTSDESDSND